MTLRVTFIVGLPGSGKTHLARSMLGHGVSLIDDFSAILQEDSDGLFTFIRRTRVVCNHFVIADPMAVQNTPDSICKGLMSYLGEDVDVTFIAFENDVEACIANLHRRNDGRHVSDAGVRAMSKVYDPYIFGDVRPVYRP